MPNLDRNPLAYPCGIASGFDPTHIANRGTWANIASFVATNGNCVSALNGLVGTKAGSPVGGINGYVGQTVSFTGGATDSIKFSKPTSLFKTVTMAAIAVPGNVGAGVYRTFIAGSDANSGWKIYTLGPEFKIVAAGVLEIGSGLNVTVGTPYFVAASGDITTMNFVVANLATGSIRTASAASATPSAGGATLIIGNDSGNFVFNGAIACGMMNASTATAGRLSLAELTAWAADPWSFWYPQRD